MLSTEMNFVRFSKAEKIRDWKIRERKTNRKDSSGLHEIQVIMIEASVTAGKTLQ